MCTRSHLQFLAKNTKTYKACSQWKPIVQLFSLEVGLFRVELCQLVLTPCSLSFKIWLGKAWKIPQIFISFLRSALKLYMGVCIRSCVFVYVGCRSLLFLCSIEFQSYRLRREEKVGLFSYLNREVSRPHLWQFL